MKITKRIAVVGMCVVGLLISSSVALAQKTAVTYETPKRLALNGIAEPDATKEPDYNTLITEAFYPIGFSKEGNFAYYTEPGDEACGCYIARLVIQDLKTDKLLWEYRYFGDDENEPADENIRSHWERNRKKFSEKLAQYNIEQQKTFTQYNPSINFGGDVFTPKLKVDIETDGVFEVDGTVTLELISKAKGRKTIYQKKYKRKDVNGFRGADISGILQSPFEARIAVIMTEILRGYEGPPHTTHARIVGSDLTSRFR